MTTGVTLTRPWASNAFFTGEQGNPLHHQEGLSFSPVSGAGHCCFSDIFNISDNCCGHTGWLECTLSLLC